ncbi:hypothetical protein B0H13DRAFT_2213181, partial [Mycena leptocephala]
LVSTALAWFLSVSCPDLPFSHLSCVHLQKRYDGRHTPSPRRPVKCRTEGIKEGEECAAGSRESYVQVLGELRVGEKCKIVTWFYKF